MDATATQCWLSSLRLCWVATKVRRRADCALWSPAPPEPSANNVAVGSYLARPLRMSHGSTERSNCSIAAAIILLLLHGGPPTVARFVVAVVVDAIYRHMRRSLAHVEQEVLKLLPSLANCNTSPTVQSEYASFRVFASAMHFDPNSVRSGWLTAGGFAMLDVFGSQPGLCVQAPARLGVPAAQGCRLDIGNTSAITFALPQHTTIARSCLFDHDKSSEPLTSQVDSAPAVPMFFHG